MISLHGKLHLLLCYHNVNICNKQIPFQIAGRGWKRRWVILNLPTVIMSEIYVTTYHVHQTVSMCTFKPE
jgi:hypothetical protein